MFSLTFWPFSVKLLWAPIVDAVYNKRIGRRKTWLLPVQYSLGLMMLWLANNVDRLIEGELRILTLCFFILNFLAATQDIAVDGWCLTMLSNKNVGWASTCNVVGQTIGYFLGHTVFLALESVDFSNNYLRPLIGLQNQDYGVMTLSRFMFFWGVVFLIVTTLVGIFKKEDKDDPDIPGVVDTYKQVFQLLKVKNVQRYILFALTSRIGLCAADSLTGLKLVEKGVPKANLALLAVPLTPISMFLPIIISKFTAGPKPLRTWSISYVPRLVIGIMFAGLVYLTGHLSVAGDLPMWYYGLLVFIFILSQIGSNCTYTSIMAFNAKISDPEIGGTYMTMLNTVTNFGGNLPQTSAMYFVDKVSTFDCFDHNSSEITNWNDKSLQDSCEMHGGTFTTVSDGYYKEIVFCTIFGIIWLRLIWKTLQRFDLDPVSSWHVGKRNYDTIPQITDEETIASRVSRRHKKAD